MICVIFDRQINIWENEQLGLKAGKQVKPVFSSLQPFIFMDSEE